MKENRGGARPGSGRPRLAKKRKYICVMVDEETDEFIRTTAEEQGVSRGKAVDLIVGNFKEMCQEIEES